MNADAFRYLYEYHFTENGNLWERALNWLTDEQFTQPVGYSVGSVRNQIVHLIEVDHVWFSQLCGVAPAFPDDDVTDRDSIRAYAARVEQEMRTYLAELRDDMLLTRPFPDGEDQNLILWQVLLHVVNHATDHRAQLLRLLNDLGVRTWPQDFVFYAYDNPPA